MALNKNIKKIADDITKDRYVIKLKGTDLKKASKAPPGKAYLFSYPNPVTKSKLDYWMDTPIAIILSRKGNTILCLNLQHLTYTYSIKLSREIARKIKDKKRSIKYGDIKAAIKSVKIPQSMLYFAIRKYRIDKIHGNVYVFNMNEYTDALKRIPRRTKKMGLGAAIKLNMSRYYEFIRKSKGKTK